MNSKNRSGSEIVKCNLCQSRDYKVVYQATTPRSGGSQFSYACSNTGHGEYYRVVRCTHCGLYFCSPRPSAAVLRNGYINLSDDIYQQELAGRIKTFQRNITNLSYYKRTGDLLDIGCMLGVFLAEAQKKGWGVAGIEPSSWGVKKAKELFNLNLRQGTLIRT